VVNVFWSFLKLTFGESAVAEHLSSPTVFSGVRVARSLVFCAMFWRSLFVHFAIILPFFLLFTSSYYSCGNVKLFLHILVLLQVLFYISVYFYMYILANFKFMRNTNILVIQNRIYVNNQKKPNDTRHLAWNHHIQIRYSI
jgi:hypothetical protein